MRKFVIKFNEKTALANISFGMLVVLTHIPYLKALNSTVINSLQLITVFLFLVGLIVYDGRLFLKSILIFVATFLYGLIYYNHVWSVYTTFFHPVRQLMLTSAFMVSGLYYFKSNNGDAKGIISRMFLIAVVITALTSIIGAIQYPEVIRSLGNGNNISGLDPKYLYSKNVASWGMMYGMALSLLPILRRYKRTRKLFLLGAAVIITVAIVMSQITFALLFAIIAWILFCFPTLSLKKVILIIIAFILVGIIFYGYIDDICLLLSNFFENRGAETLQRRFYQLYISFKYKAAYGDAAVRFNLYLVSIRTFFNNPIIGLKISAIDYRDIGMHSQVFDTLGATGIIGTLLYFGSFIKISHDCIIIQHDNERIYFIFNIVILVLFMFLNPTWYSPESYFSAFALPALINGLYDEENRKTLS